MERSSVIAGTSPILTKDSEGSEVIRWLLDQPSPPLSLKQDLLETSARLCHRSIAEIQCEVESTRRRICAQVVAKTEQYMLAHPERQKEVLEEAAKRFANDQVSAVREEASLRIAIVHREQELRDDAIRQFCSAREGAPCPASV